LPNKADAFYWPPLTYKISKQISAIADGPARRGNARGSCYMQRWTLSVINCMAKLTARTSIFASIVNLLRDKNCTDELSPVELSSSIDMP